MVAVASLCADRIGDTIRRRAEALQRREVSMNAVHPSPPPEDSIVEVVPVVRRVVASRVVDPATRDDIVQETLARLMASHSRVEQDTLVPYAIAIARNLIASLAEREQRSRRNAHLLVETDDPEPRPDDEFLRQEEALIVGPRLLACRRRSAKSCSRTRWTARMWPRLRPAVAPHRVRLPLSSTARGRGCAWSICWPRVRRTRRPIAAGRR